MNLYVVGSALNLATLYMLAGIGSTLSIQCGELNLGGEGQIYLGGFIAAIVLNCSFIYKFPPFFAYVIAIFCAFAASGLLGLLSGFLYRKKNANILFSTFIASIAVIPFIDGLIAGPCRGKTGNLLATQFIPEKFRFTPILKPSTLNSTFFISICVCFTVAYILSRTKMGRKHCIFGKSHEFAEYIGYDLNSIIYHATFYSAGYHGICGAVAICGTYYTCHSGFYVGLGWNALTAALIAGGNTIALVFSSIVLAFIITYSNRIGIYTQLGFDVSSILQAVLLFVIANVRGVRNDS